MIPASGSHCAQAACAAARDDADRNRAGHGAGSARTPR
jgi:hypothetical protein